MRSKMKKVFVVDDEKDVLISIKSWSLKKNYNVTTFESSTEGLLDSLIKIKPQVVLLDINLKNDDGRYVSEDLKNILPFPVKIILISADTQALSEYNTYHADDILNKPFTFKELEEKIIKHLH